jgi:hypothetical protein
MIVTAFCAMAGFGDPVTDWFFRSALSADDAETHYQLDQPKDLDRSALSLIPWMAIRWRESS